MQGEKLRPWKVLWAFKIRRWGQYRIQIDINLIHTTTTSTNFSLLVVLCWPKEVGELLKKVIFIPVKSSDYYLKHTMSLVNVDTILVEITASIFRIQLNISNTAHCYMEQKTKTGSTLTMDVKESLQSFMAVTYLQFDSMLDSEQQ